VRFQRPLLGAEEWACMAEGAIAAGERVRVVSVEGSFVKVAKA
jgi:membrane-bound ClpP family serine protease